MNHFARRFLFAMAACAIASSGTVQASVVMTEQPAPSVSLIVLDPPLFACFDGLPCIAPWASWTLPMLAVGDAATITTASSNFSFDLGSGLSGLHKVTITPTFASSLGPIDELRANLANSQSILGVTTSGESVFSASNDTHYYVMLSGEVRAGETYTLLVSAVPEPETYLFIAIGLGVVMLRVRQTNRFRKSQFN